MRQTIVRVFHLLSRRGKRKIYLFTLAQVILNLLDLLGVALVGIVLALSVTSIESRPPSSRISSVLNLIGISQQDFRTQISILGILAGALLIIKTVLSIYFTKSTLHELSRQAAEISNAKTEQVLSLTLKQLQEHSKQDYLFSILTGVRLLIMDLISSIITFVSDSTLVIIIAAGLVMVDPSIAAICFILFSALALTLYKALHRKALDLGDENTETSIRTAEYLSQAIDAYREIVVSNTQSHFIKQFGISRKRMTKTTADMAFLPNISKYILESSVVLGTIILGGLEFASKDAVHAASTLTIFMAAASRIAPAVLRIQQGLMSFKNSIGQGQRTLDLFDELDQYQKSSLELNESNSESMEFAGSLSITNLDFGYEENGGMLFNELNLSISPGEFLAITGPSGSGKTTLVDLILGLQKPSAGSIRISNVPAHQATKIWAGKVAYVPQDVVLIQGTVLENVSFGHEIDALTESKAWNALRLANIEDFVRMLPLGIHQNVGELGNRMSGGQKQRLGIARALFTDPKFLVLDEATSALDAKTESGISESLRNLHGKVTIVMIAHRLSTVLDAEKVIYLQNGNIVEQGTFAEIRAKVPDFDDQAKLMGLN